MPSSPRHRNILIKKAKEDLKAAMDMTKTENFSEEIVLFHCQQAVEKALKAFLDAHEITYHKIHDLEVLLSICINKDPSFAEIQFVALLTPFAVEIRYDEFVDMPKEEVVDILKRTETALSFIINKTVILN